MSWKGSTSAYDDFAAILKRDPAVKQDRLAEIFFGFELSIDDDRRLRWHDLGGNSLADRN